MKLTQRGIKLSAFSASLLLISLAYLDLALGLLLLAVILTSLYDLLKLRALSKAIGKLVRLEPEKEEVRVEAGNEAVVRMEVESQVEVKLVEPYPFLSFKPESLTGRGSIALTIAPNLAGRYDIDELTAEITSPLGLFSTYVKIPFRLKVKAYPRLIRPLMEALKALQGLGFFGESEAISELVGEGIEYAWSKPYRLGDRMRRIDWKATARMNELYVKAFFVEGGSSTRIVYDVRVPGPVSLDSVSATMLSTVVQLARLSATLSFTVLSDEEVLSLERLEPREAIRTAIRYALRYVFKEPEEVFEYLEPLDPRLLRELRGIVEDERLKLLIEEELKEVKPLKLGAEEVFWISSLTHDLSLIAEASRSTRVYVLAIAKPWLDAKSLEEAYVMKKRFEKAIAWLDRAKVPVARDISKIPLILRY